MTIYAVLEGRALELSILEHQFSPPDFEYLENLQSKMGACVKDNDYSKYQELNVDFHNFLRKKCPNHELNNTLIELDEKTLFYRKMGVTPGRLDLQSSLDGHMEITAAIKQEAAFEARRLLESHVREGRLSLSSKNFEKISSMVWR